ncbi:hypothetical protein EST38_g7176 [Candolleomyces aberdarensis]|uniref:Uncharacterized protein n=1 Tax=Candolleomyces aberdarensis TaxID=2316362 RepID=A0A4Q2DFS7_9AGAR|nr:hypothetical protein EST38_g7176 [Candolleomyces aberdarensis]
MSLENGTYTITNQLTNSPVGSLDGTGSNPVSRVVTLPREMKAPSWKLIKEGDGFYRLTQERGAAIEINGLLFLSERVEDKFLTTWRVEPAPQNGENAYIITNLKLGGPSSGWVVTEPAPYAQVAVRPLISTPSLTPPFPSNEVFDIVRDDRDGDDAN